MNKILKEKDKYTFISSTGYKTLLIFRLLLEKPCSIEDIKEELLKDNYIHELVADDTIRMYINSLRSEGCDISKATKTTNNKFVMSSHPFEFKMTPAYLDVLKKISKHIQNKKDITDLENFESFILKLITFLKNKDDIDFLHGLLILNNLNKDIYNQLKDCCKNKLSALVVYNSAGTGHQELEIICDKIFVKSKNVYIAGPNSKHKNYASLLINRIEKVVSTKPFLQNSLLLDEKSVICEIYDPEYIIEEGDELIVRNSDKLVVAINGKDEFRILQKILYLGDSCKVLKPDSFKNKIISQLKEMRKLYD